MEETIAQLELRRTRLYEQMAALGDLRRGSISVNFRKCGKSNCACSRAGHRGHGPQYLWNTTIGGKSLAENVRLGPALEKVRKEVENHRTFVRWCKEVVEINEKLCRLRPVKEVQDEQELEALKKNLQKQFAGKLNKK